MANIERAKLRQDLINRANVAGMKSGSPEIYHIVVGLLAYIDGNYSQLEQSDNQKEWFTAKQHLSTHGSGS